MATDEGGFRAYAAAAGAVVRRLFWFGFFKGAPAIRCTAPECRSDPMAVDGQPFGCLHARQEMASYSMRVSAREHAKPELGARGVR